jgi:hypothetical protein
VGLIQFLISLYLVMASGLAVVSAADPAVVVGFRVFERRVQLDLVVVVSGVL